MAAKTPKQRRAARAASRRRRRKQNFITLLILLAVLLLAVLLLARGCHTSTEKTEASAIMSKAESETTNPSFDVAVSDTNEESSFVSTPENSLVEEADGVTLVSGVPVVNKTYGVSVSYVPANLVDIGNNMQLDATCYEAFLKMASQAYDEGVVLWVASGYRDYATQEKLYETYAAADGEQAADSYSARPGSSEHHTGLAIDLNTVNEAFGETPEGKWVVEHGAEYGFILRYPQGKEEETGYMYEPWHIRYVGEELARKITDSGLCFEEYFGITSVYAE